MTNTTIITEADKLVARKVRFIWVAVLIMIQKNAVKVALEDGEKVYRYTGNGQVVSRKVIQTLGKAGLVHMLAGQPRLTTPGTVKFYLFVNNRPVSL